MSVLGTLCADTPSPHDASQTPMYCFLIGRKFASSNEKHCPDLRNDASSVWMISALVPQSFSGEASGEVAKCQPRTQASSHYLGDQRRPGTERDSASANSSANFSHKLDRRRHIS